MAAISEAVLAGLGHPNGAATGCGKSTIARLRGATGGSPARCRCSGSDSAVAAGQKIRGGHIQIYYSGFDAFEGTWWDDYSLDDYGIALFMPDEFQKNPVAWFEAEILKLGFRQPEESRV